MHDVVAHTILHMYREFSPQAQFCAMIPLLALRSSIIAIGVFHVFLVSIVYQPLVSTTNLIYILGA